TAPTGADSYRYNHINHHDTHTQPAPKPSSSRYQRSRHHSADSSVSETEQQQSLLQNSYENPSSSAQPNHNSAPSPAVRFNEAQLAMFSAQSAPMAGLKDELTLAAGKVTPGVDDTPHIQYAIDALTGRRRGDDDEYDELDLQDAALGRQQQRRRRFQNFQPAGEYQPVDQAVTHPDSPLRQLPPLTRERTPTTSHPPPLVMPETVYGSPNRIGHRASISETTSLPRTPVSQDERFRPLSPVSTRIITPFFPAEQGEGEYQQHSQQSLPQPIAGPFTRSVPARAGPDMWVPVTRNMRDNFYPSEAAYPPLTYKPRLLRPYSFIFFILLCLAMVACLITATLYSNSHDGLTPYSGTIYSGTYFLFRILPQLVAALILVYAQAVAITSQRILPFASMASEDARDRYLSLFRNLYPSSLLWPRGVSSGPWQAAVFSVVSWLALFTVPLASSLFTCILDGEVWTWAPVRGIAWTLVGLYAVMAVAGAVLMAFWLRRWTGLMWDPRSIADVVTLLNRSNTTDGYAAADGASTTRSLRDLLPSRWLDRLGYWRTDGDHTGSIWYGIGTPGTFGDREAHLVSELMGKRISHNTSSSIASDDVPSTGAYARSYEHLPGFLRTGPILVFAATSGVLLVGLMVVSFLPQTQLDRGFLPKLSAKPVQPGAFSAANFLYSFVPSLLGIVLFLLIQSLDQAVRVVQPWAELTSPLGGVARKSILAEYAACCHPLEATWRSARVGHWRVTVLSLVASLSVGIPVLAGGLFMALTTGSGRVRMFPNIPVYGVLLALLFLYVGSVTMMVPRRDGFRLPHAVTCIAGLVSLCTADELTRDAAFRSVRSRADLEARLGVDRDADLREESVWCFGVVPGRDEQRLSVRRLRRFTEKMPLYRDHATSMV
ncbi:Protein of unknown function (DUF3433), partial [Geosmithia morbida]